MKKIYFLFLILYISIANVYGNECSQNCRIADEASPGLRDYFSDIDTLKSTIIESINGVEEDERLSALEGINDERNRVIRSLNEILNFGDYFCSFDFNVTLAITNELPSQVKRDHMRLQNITTMLTSVLENAERKNAAGVNVTNVCNGVKNCSIQSGSARTLLTEMIKNNDRILQLFRGSILEKPCSPNNENIIFVNSNFIGEIENYYNKDTLTACSSCKEEFMGRIDERIRNISFFNSDFKAGVQAWRDAWAMLKGGVVRGENPEVRERQEAETLSRQGRNMSQADIINNNRDRYGEGGVSTDDENTNASANSLVQVRSNINSFQETLRERFEGRESIPNQEVSRVEPQIEDSQDISRSISALYESQIPSALVQDTLAEEVQMRIIRMHLSLVRSINILERYVPRSEQLCERQGTGMGQCSYR